jgi:menaquinol-cytochrome c reductase iron-sulfur subunit
VADDGTTRGQFLSLSTVGMGAMIGAVIGVPTTAYILAPVTDEAQFEPVFLGKVDGFPADPSFKPTPATYVEDPQSPATSPGLAFVQNTGKTNTDWLAADAMFIVFSNRCMHLGCPVAVAQGVGFACPCHGGQYDKEGRRTAGPPIRPLDRFQWEIKNTDELWITQRWSVDFNGDGKILYFPVKLPGQPVAPPGPSIVADVLYPNVTYDHGAIPQAK